MARKTIEELKQRRLAAASAEERVAFEETYAAVTREVRVDEQNRRAHEASED